MKTTLKIKGMHCSACKMLIEDSLSELEGVKTAVVSVEDGTAVVEHDTSNNSLIKTIEQEGYEVENGN